MMKEWFKKLNEEKLFALLVSGVCSLYIFILSFFEKKFLIMICNNGYFAWGNVIAGVAIYVAYKQSNSWKERMFRSKQNEIEDKILPFLHNLKLKEVFIKNLLEDTINEFE